MDLLVVQTLSYSVVAKPHMAPSLQAELKNTAAVAGCREETAAAEAVSEAQQLLERSS